MTFLRRRERTLISVSLALLTISCRSQSNFVTNENSTTDTVVSSTPPFQTKEPDRYRATRTVTVVAANGQTVATKSLIARDGDVRRSESQVASKTMVYLESPEGRFVLSPDEKIYAEIAGFASVSSAYHMTNLALDGAALAQAFRLALLDAGIEAGAIDHVNAHGSSTRQNDLSETNAIRSVMGRHAGSVTVNSLKSMIGHALGASNALEIGAAAISLKEQFAFPTINLDNPGPGCNLDYVPNRGRARPAEYLAKFSNGFSGVHSVLVMRRAAA